MIKITRNVFINIIYTYISIVHNRGVRTDTTNTVGFCCCLKLFLGLSGPKKAYLMDFRVKQKNYIANNY